MESLNQRALRVADDLHADAAGYGIAVSSIAGATIIDSGAKAPGGLRAGIHLAQACLAGLADVALVPGDDTSLSLSRIQVSTDQPLLACMASQYAGWQISVGSYFAMGSGPMRAHYGKEKLFDDIPGRETALHAVGVLEGKLPTDEAISWLAEKLRLAPECLTLLVARTRSLAGTVQVVARALELTLHKLHELHFDLGQIRSGYGLAPLPPPAADDFVAMGRTNDAILYGGHSTLWLDADDDALAEIGPKVPSTASAEHGALFGELFAKHKDFYKMDPLLFSPATVTFHNLRSGRTHRFGKIAPDVLRRSFGI